MGKNLKIGLFLKLDNAIVRTQTRLIFVSKKMKNWHWFFYQSENYQRYSWVWKVCGLDTRDKVSKGPSFRLLRGRTRRNGWQEGLIMEAKEWNENNDWRGVKEIYLAKVLTDVGTVKFNERKTTELYRTIS